MSIKNLHREWWRMGTLPSQSAKIRRICTENSEAKHELSTKVCSTRIYNLAKCKAAKPLRTRSINFLHLKSFQIMNLISVKKLTIFSRLLISWVRSKVFIGQPCFYGSCTVSSFCEKKLNSAPSVLMQQCRRACAWNRVAAYINHNRVESWSWECLQIKRQWHEIWVFFPLLLLLAELQNVHENFSQEGTGLHMQL